jgi:hypothetical protein
VNGSLLNLQQSESFANNAASMTATFDDNAGHLPGKTAAAASLTVSYDVTANAYTVTTSAGAQTFGPDHADSGQSNGARSVYTRVSGNVTDTLTLTKPGTSGPTYQYVGGGLWQHETDNGTTRDYRLAAFAYGVETPNSVLPRTGSASYAVTLSGAMAWGTNVAMEGEGTLQANFASGSLLTEGELRSVSLQTGSVLETFSFTGNANISSSTNGFSGEFDFARVGQSPFEGSMSGQFYGPQAQEVGAAWYAVDANGKTAAGTILGRVDPNAPILDPTLTNLQQDLSIFAPQASNDYWLSVNGSAAEPLGATSGMVTFSYDAETKSYGFQIPGELNYTFGPGQRVAAQSNSRFSVFEIPGGASEPSYRLRLYNPGTGNTELALTYASFGHWRQTNLVQDTGRGQSDTYFIWGIKTDATLMPRTGTAHYAGILHGTGVTTAANGPLWTLTGTSAFDLDFASLIFTGSLDIDGSASNGQTRDFGTYNINLGGINIFDAALSGDILNGASQTVGTFQGQLFGPEAEELGGVFRIVSPPLGSMNPPGLEHVYLTGATVAAR